MKNNSPTPNEKKKVIIPVKTIFLIAALVYIILIIFGVIHADNKLRIEDYGLIAFALLLAIGFFDNLGAFSFGSQGISIQLNQIKDRQDEHADALRAIQVVLKGLITKYEYEHLRRLSLDIPYTVRYGNIFFDEIKELDSKNLVRPTQGIQSRGFNAILLDHQNDANEFDLKYYIEITPEGLEYVKMREQVTAQS